MATYFAGEDEVMPHYISLLNWTDQGIKNVKESPKRADAATALASKLGAKMQIFYTMGEYDLVSVTEAPNDDIAMQVLLELGQLGNIRTKTLKAWSLAEATKVVSKLQETRPSNARSFVRLEAGSPDYPSARGR